MDNNYNTRIPKEGFSVKINLGVGYFAKPMADDKVAEINILLLDSDVDIFPYDKSFSIYFNSGLQAAAASETSKLWGLGQNT